MPRKRARNERTSKTVASAAGELLNGSDVKSAEGWLRFVSRHTRHTPGDPIGRHARVLLKALRAGRRVAASALTQR